MQSTLFSDKHTFRDRRKQPTPSSQTRIQLAPTLLCRRLLLCAVHSPISHRTMTCRPKNPFASSSLCTDRLKIWNCSMMFDITGWSLMPNLRPWRRVRQPSKLPPDPNLHSPPESKVCRHSLIPVGT